MEPQWILTYPSRRQNKYRVNINCEKSMRFPGNWLHQPSQFLRNSEHGTLAISMVLSDCPNMHEDQQVEQSPGIIKTQWHKHTNENSKVHAFNILATAHTSQHFGYCSYLTSCMKKVGNFCHWYKVGDMRLPCGCCSPIDFQWSLFNNAFYSVST
jgi:hypothetical protein